MLKSFPLAPRPSSSFKKFLIYFFTVSAVLFVVISFIIYGIFLEDLPDYKSLATYEPPIVTRIYSSDGKLFAEYATEKRIFVPIESIPLPVIQAFLAVEDKNFYHHKGLDYLGIIRALFSNVQGHLWGKKSLAGGSTITQQVAKNFLLSNEKTLTRKIKEALLAFRIERNFSKNKILELYLNEIYLGNHAYGVASAAIQYFNKPLESLSIAEIAYLAALPKAPNFYNATKHPQAALYRRNWVIQRMLEENFITPPQALEATQTPLKYDIASPTDLIRADHCAELIRQHLYKNYGPDSLYKGGLTVKTTLNANLQAYARQSLREGLIAYDRQAGWRGPVAHIPLGDWKTSLNRIKIPLGVPFWTTAVVLQLTPTHAIIGLKNGNPGTISFENMKWARKYIAPQPPSKYPSVGYSPHSPADVLKVGDVIVVKHIEKSTYSLEQIPQVNGALIAMDPHTGRILAMEGGFSFARSQFNWVTQAKRQTGSAFKPFVYLAALQKGFAPNSLLQDEPIEVDMGPTLGIWKPGNITDKTFGTVTLRTAFEQSLNLAIVWLTMQMGLRPVQEIAQKFGIYDHVPPEMAIVLGSLETTLLKLTTAYAILANGGRPITPKFIDRIQDRYGHTLFRSAPPSPQQLWQEQAAPLPPPSEDTLVADPVAIYQTRSIMQGGVERGTAKSAQVPNHRVAGKTGTSNDYNDAWFIGMTPSLTVGVLVGFDQPKSLGRYQTGSRVAAPIFAAFMKKALKEIPNLPYPFPDNAKISWVDLKTGKPTYTSAPGAVLEVFKDIPPSA